MAWDIDAQLEHDVYVRTVTINPTTLKYSKDHRNWAWLRKADLVFVYCSLSRQYPNVWEWFSLPKYARKFMKPEAKMIAQWDQEFVWLFHPTWTWWRRPPYSTTKSPEQFFRDNGVLEVADVHFTVLEKPLFQEYTSTPYIYMSLPQLIRYGHYTFNTNRQRIALLNHTSQAGTINHTVKNVARAYEYPVSIFNSGNPHRPLSGRIFCANHRLPMGSVIYGRLARNDFMQKLSQCYVAIDDAENYLGWSRFTMECALTFVPCIGSNYANKLFFPDLYVKHKNYKKQRELVKQLYEDPDFYKRVALEGHRKARTQLDTETLRKKFLNVGKKLGSPNTEIDTPRYLFIQFLATHLPSHLPSRRPQADSEVYDAIHRRTLTVEQWDEVYSKWKHFLLDRKVYKELLAIASKEQNQWRMLR